MSGLGRVSTWYGGSQEEGLDKVSIRSRQGLDKVSIRVLAKWGWSMAGVVGIQGAYFPNYIHNQSIPVFKAGFSNLSTLKDGKLYRFASLAGLESKFIIPVATKPNKSCKARKALPDLQFYL